MPALAEVHLVSDPDYFPKAMALQMISLSDHPADEREAVKAPRFASRERKAFEMRKDSSEQIRDRAGVVLVGPIGSGLPDPSAAEKCL